MKTIYGLEDYSYDEVCSMVKDYVENILADNDMNDIEIVDVQLHGSRLRGQSKESSDLDAVVEYNGDFPEDSLFDILNENPLTIEGITVDINPINSEDSCSMTDYMKRSAEYDRRVTSLESRIVKLEEALEKYKKYFKNH